MFRQKVDDTTNCSCRLIPNQSKEFIVFKTLNSSIKVINKQPKQKFSLKTQTVSSNKHQSKVVISAHKTSLKPIKLYQEEKFDVSGNRDPVKQKLQKHFLCSPDNNLFKFKTQNMILTSKIASEKRDFSMIKNSVKTSQKNQAKQPKKTEANSHTHKNPKIYQNKDFLVSNFNNQKPASSNETFYKDSGIPKKSLNFEEYYKNVSNPYAANDKNKQNFCSGDNPQVSKYKIDLKMKKQYRKQRNQGMPLQQINIDPQPQIFDQPFEKKQRMRYTFKESLITNNSMHSQIDSMKISKNIFSLINSKAVNLEQNPSLQFNKLNDQYESNHLKHNYSEALINKNFYTNAYRISTNDVNGGQLRQGFTVKIDYNNGLVSKGGNTIGFPQNQRNYYTLQNSIVENFHQPLTNLSCNQLKPTPIQNELKMVQSTLQKVIIQKISTFKDIINSTNQCESFLEEGDLSYNENQQSVVIMRYKEKAEQVHGLSQFDQNTLQKPENLQIGPKKREKCLDNLMIDNIKLLTSTKHTEKMIYHQSQENTIAVLQNMKRTVKPNKQYLAHNFSSVK